MVIVRHCGGGDVEKADPELVGFEKNAVKVAADGTALLTLSIE